MLELEDKLPFISEWRMLFGGEEMVNASKIQKYCLRGRLRESRIRSIVWRILLRVFPLDRAEWGSVISQSRLHYSELKKELEIDPRNACKSGDDNTDVNNPLSLFKENPWCQYFANQELRNSINKDVDRTFPDIQFFKQEHIRSIMSKVLFVYCRNNPHKSYQQGMHELLAPIIFVLDTDRKAFQHLKEQGVLGLERGISDEVVQLLDTINDASFLEHDAFAMLTQLVMLVGHFYSHQNRTGGSTINLNSATASAISFKSHLRRAPFCDKQGEASELSQKLESIHDELLLEIDPALHHHLNSHEILPQLYGVRWLRLLFGREFPLLDLLFVWDVIFADQQDLVIVDYIFVALLIKIRHLLISGDYSTCVQYLMRYPPVPDVHTFVQFTLHLKSPKKFSRPEGFLQSGVQKTINNTINAMPNSNDERTTTSLAKSSPKQSLVKIRPIDGILEKIGRRPLSVQSQSLPRNDSKTSFTTTSSGDCGRSLDAANRKKRKESTRISAQVEINGELMLMKEQISLLQSRLNDVDLLAQISARRVNSCADEIEKSADVEANKRVVDELREVAEQLERSTISEQFILRYAQFPSAPSSGMKSEAVEMASEVSSYQPPSPAGAASRSRLSSKSLHNGNEMVELRFDRKKNF